MPADRIISPEQIADTIRAYLSGSIDGIEAAWRAMSLAGSTDRILAGHQTPVVVAAYWSLRRLAETGAGRPAREEMQFLLDCIEGRRRYRLAANA